jgi:SAM-dependent methyltransferase
MAGGKEAGYERNRAFFRHIEAEKFPRGLAIDLGAGSGFQSVPLAEMGFEVIAVDTDATLLAELHENAHDLPIRIVQANLLNFAASLDKCSQLIVCMGDTLPHLASKDVVRTLISHIAEALAPQGKVIFTFRDYVSTEPQGIHRFIPVRSDPSRILTCFLEYHAESVEVHDILHEKIGEQWTLKVSSYPKLRLDKNWVSDVLHTAGLTLVRDEYLNGMITLIAEKSSEITLQ